MEYTETFTYQDKADLIKQLDARLAELLVESPMIPYAQVRARYNLSPSAFTMRLKRFPGTFPHRRGPKGEKILKLFVTQALDAYLRK